MFYNGLCEIVKAFVLGFVKMPLLLLMKGEKEINIM